MIDGHIRGEKKRAHAALKDLWGASTKDWSGVLAINSMTVALPAQLMLAETNGVALPNKSNTAQSAAPF
ncbi:MAG: hypothetical protein AAF922_16290 [Pseudomonadota bacterium]